MKFDFNDILIEPTKTSSIRYRNTINILNDYRLLPLITAPMDTVINSDNSPKFLSRGILPCLPRNEKGICFKSEFKSYGLNEFEEFLDKDKLYPMGKYLIDIANGHMVELVRVIKKTKAKHPKIILMVGNIANPETYKILSEAGADLIRCGIGMGNGCLTAKNTGIGYPMGSLIKECYDISCTLDNPAKIIADGGMKSYSDIIKSLALGADYVMLGSILNKTLESAGPNYLWKKIRISQKTANWLHKRGFTIWKKFRGMSTKEVQKKWGAIKLKTSEGVVRYRKVEYTLDKWVENFEDYLRSTMSYCGSKNLDEFIGKVKYNLITSNSYRRFDK